MNLSLNIGFIEEFRRDECNTVFVDVAYWNKGFSMK
jgi:hypothetical protein